jgi:hypothetical protein
MGRRSAESTKKEQSNNSADFPPSTTVRKACVRVCVGAYVCVQKPAATGPSPSSNNRRRLEDLPQQHHVMLKSTSSVFPPSLRVLPPWTATLPATHTSTHTHLHTKPHRQLLLCRAFNSFVFHRRLPRRWNGGARASALPTTATAVIGSPRAAT